MSQQMPDDNSLAKKMQALISSPQAQAATVEAKPASTNATFDGIPRKIPAPVEPPASARQAPRAEAPKPDQTPAAPAEKRSRTESFLRALWTITSVISMTVNVVIVILLLLLLKYLPINTIKAAVTNLPPGIGMNTPLDLLKGLYDNFEKMDNAHIQTNILVQDQIPVQFTLGLKQTTSVILSESVTIDGARVALTTGGLNIFNAPATVVLPAGTSLPIVLNLEVPVDKMIPITINVPVDIALKETDLHTPFTGLQTVVEPLYCLVSPDATSELTGAAICSQEPPQE